MRVRSQVISSTLEWPPVTCMQGAPGQRVLLRRQVTIVRAQTNELKSEVRRLQAWLSSQTDMIESTLTQAEAAIDRDCGLKETSLHDSANLALEWME